MQHPRARPLGALIGAFGALLVCGASAQSETQPGIRSGDQIDVGLRDGLLTLRTAAVPADQLAAALHDATGIAFVVTGESSTPLSADIFDEPLHKAIALLAPNHMLVREDKRPDSRIIEVVMMMPDAADGSGADSAEFLPSGAPADDVGVDSQPGGPQDIEYDQNGLAIDDTGLRDPNRSDALREVQAEQGMALDQNGLPIDGSESEFQPEPDIDPVTGEVRQP